MGKKITRTFPEVALRSFEAAELRELRAGNEECDAALEPNQNAFRNEVNDDAGLNEPGDKRDRANEQGGACRQRTEARGIPTGEVAARCAHQNGDCRRNGDGCMSRAAK